MTFMAFRLFQLVISCKPQPAIEKTVQIASRERFRRDAGQTGQKLDVPAKTGRLATLSGPDKHLKTSTFDMSLTTQTFCVLLVFFFWVYKPAAQVSMKKYDGNVIDIKATALNLGDKCFDLLAVHALSGCDTVSYPFGKGKISALNLLPKLDLNLQVFTEPAAEEVDWMKAEIDFLSYLYCGKIMESLNTI